MHADISIPQSKFTAALPTRGVAVERAGLPLRPSGAAGSPFSVTNLNTSADLSGDAGRDRNVPAGGLEALTARGLPS